MTDSILSSSIRAERSIAAKQAAQHRPVDNQGQPLGPPVVCEYDLEGRLIGPVKANPTDDPAA
jgi:hypothetical protein